MQIGLSIGITKLLPLLDAVAAVQAIVAPVAQDLLAGNTVGDITNIATLRSTANYIADGTVQTPEIRVNGTARPDSFALSEGDVVVLYVADNAGSTPYQRTIDASVAAIAQWAVQDGTDGSLTIQTSVANGAAPIVTNLADGRMRIGA